MPHKLPEFLVRACIAGESRIANLPRLGMRPTSKLLMRLKARFAISKVVAIMSFLEFAVLSHLLSAHHREVL
jgi:hypothetical protein